jgi:glycine cleavage system H lipoate-binding protein
MITALFVILVVGAIALHYLFVERPRRGEAGIEPSVPEPITLSEAMEEPPDGLFLQPSFTWTRIRKNGEFFVGVHPLLLSLVGPDTTLEFVADETDLEKGDPLLILRLGNRELRLFSPLAGRVLEANDAFLPQTGWAGATSRGGSWLYRIRPRHAEKEVPLWLLGADASNWAHKEYRQVRDFLFDTVSHAEVGLSAADGGELPSGVLSQLSAETWSSFQDRFIPDPEDSQLKE